PPSTRTSWPAPGKRATSRRPRRSSPAAPPPTSPTPAPDGGRDPGGREGAGIAGPFRIPGRRSAQLLQHVLRGGDAVLARCFHEQLAHHPVLDQHGEDRKSTRLNSS